MKSKFLSFSAVSMLMLVASASAADILGTWIATIPDNQRMGEAIFNFRMEEIVFSFRVDGEKLTGTVTDPHGKYAISEGEMNGDEISFIVIGGAGGGGTTLAYKGKVALNEIKFTRAPKDGTGQQQDFTATREFLRHNDYIHRQIITPIQHPPLR